MVPMRYARLMWTRDSDKDRMSSSVKALTPTVCPGKLAIIPPSPAMRKIIRLFTLSSCPSWGRSYS